MDTEKEITDLKFKMADHRHDGNYTEKLSDFFCITNNLYNGEANSQAYYNSFWIAPFDCKVTKIEVWYPASSNPTELFINVYKQTASQQTSAGTSLLASTISTGQAAPIVMTGSLAADVSIPAGNKIGWYINATTTTFPTCGITVTLQKV